MKPSQSAPEPDYDELVERVDYDFGLKRRSFMQMLGAGLLVAASAPALAQRAGRRGFGGSGAKSIGARIHLGADGTITVLTGKVEAGQGARAELTQAAAEELRVAPDRVRLLMADTALVPDDGITAGSRTTPSTVPSIRRACAAARNLLIGLAAEKWQVDRDKIAVSDGVASEKSGSDRKLTYADLATAEQSAQALK